MLAMVMIAYNEAVDAEVMEVLNAAGTPNYTKMHSVFGKGTTSGTHLGDDIWPGLNNTLFIACNDKQARVLLEGVRQLRKELGKEGVKAFLLPLTELT